MKCPVDNATLLITDRSGIEIDYCPECRGVWLDRGELDKLIQNSTSHNEPHHDDRQREQRRSYDGDRDHDTYDQRDSRREGDNRHKKKESFLGDIFDF